MMVGLLRWGEADLFKQRHCIHKQIDAASKACGRRSMCPNRNMVDMRGGQQARHDEASPLRSRHNHQHREHGCSPRSLIHQTADATLAQHCGFLEDQTGFISSELLCVCVWLRVGKRLQKTGGATICSRAHTVMSLKYLKYFCQLIS